MEIRKINISKNFFVVSIQEKLKSNFTKVVKAKLKIF